MPRTLAACVCLCALLLAGTASGQQKKRVAVLSFDDAAVKSSSAAALGSNQDVGASLADVLVNELVKSGTYSIVERRAIDAVMKEQNLSNSSRADTKTAADIGRVLGVDAIIAGSVFQFGVETREVAIGSSTIGRLTGGAIGGGKQVNATARVGITARLIDASSGEVLTSASGSGESGKSSVGATGYATGVIDMTSSTFQGTILGEAVSQAARKVAASLNEFGAKLSSARQPYSGQVADVTGSSLIVNVGRLKGVRIGDTIQITRPGRQIPDPQTKKILVTLVDTIGTATIIAVEDGYATATLTGTATVQVGDQVQRVE